jgi:hypothetical protein
MSLISAFKFKTAPMANSEIPEIYPLRLQFNFFVNSDVENIYSKILTDCIERTEGIPEAFQTAIWDNCLQSEASKGLVSLLSEAMTSKADLFLVFNRAVGVLRIANQSEQGQIKADYQRQGSSPVGVYISFRNYKRTDMLKVYSEMEYSVLNSLNKSMNLSKAVQLKLKDLRGTVGAFDAAEIIAQGKSIANALSGGNDIMLDAGDEITTSKPDMESTEKAIMFLDAKRAFLLNLPLSYINGEQTGGIGSTGEADTRAVERGLKHYWISIIKPALSAIFGINPTFKSHDFRQISSGMEALKTFELTGEDLISIENKRLIVSKLFDIPNDLKGKPVNDDSSPAGRDAEENSTEV